MNWEKHWENAAIRRLWLRLLLRVLFVCIQSLNARLRHYQAVMRAATAVAKSIACGCPIRLNTYLRLDQAPTTAATTVAKGVTSGIQRINAWWRHDQATKTTATAVAKGVAMGMLCLNTWWRREQAASNYLHSFSQKPSQIDLKERCWF